VESIPTIAATGTVDESDDSDKANTEPPAWPRARYKLKCIRENGVWRIDSVELVENLPPEPTASPEPSTYITASPVPTTAPSPSASAAVSPSPAASASPAPTK
jgi:hypothetical protein